MYLALVNRDHIASVSAVFGRHTSRRASIRVTM
jgi:hypothetical protein